MLELKTVLRCEHGEAVLPNCACVTRLSQVAEEASDRIQDRDRLLDALTRLVHELPRGDRGNAPGHSHKVPGIWDSDNGALSGSPCRLCDAYARAILLVGAP